VRFRITIALSLIAATAQAQDQERKLVDRLLEPNARMENSAQNKQFTGADAVTAKSASTRSFYVSNTKLTKTFAGTREARTRSYSTAQVATQPANLPASQRTRTFATADVRGISTDREQSRKYGIRQFAGNRPYLEQGKSQKALHQQDHPLSIDDIRELLNKNK
jgi:hypothetical protein